MVKLYDGNMMLVYFAGDEVSTNTFLVKIAL